MKQEYTFDVPAIKELLIDFVERYGKHLINKEEIIDGCIKKNFVYRDPITGKENWDLEWDLPDVADWLIEFADKWRMPAYIDEVTKFLKLYGYTDEDLEGAFEKELEEIKEEELRKEEGLSKESTLKLNSNTYLLDKKSSEFSEIETIVKKIASEHHITNVKDIHLVLDPTQGIVKFALKTENPNTFMIAEIDTNEPIGSMDIEEIDTGTDFETIITKVELDPTQYDTIIKELNDIKIQGPMPWKMLRSVIDSTLESERLFRKTY